MNALVGYGSSDEGDDDVQSPRPAKVARTDAQDGAVDAKTTLESPEPGREPEPARSLSLSEDKAPLPERESDSAPGPSIEPQQDDLTPSLPPSEPQSPYTTSIQRIQALTMPTCPNFDIPASPPPPPRNSEEAATLAAITKKFQHFLELKQQGIHFHDRLQKSSALRNPSLLPKLMKFAGISEEESHASSLPSELAVPVKWPKECYVEELVRMNDWKEKKRKAERERIDFVQAGSSRGSSATTTPKDRFPGKDGVSKKSKLDR